MIVARTLALALVFVLLVLLVVETVRGAVPRRVDRELRYAANKFGVPYWEMRFVSFCESRWNPRAVGAGSYGLFQFTTATFQSTPYGRYSVFDPHWNALAAAWLVRHDGSWRQWSCAP